MSRTGRRRPSRSCARSPPECRRHDEAASDAVRVGCSAVASSCHFPRTEGEPMSAAEKTYPGQCFCGAVTIEVTGEPVGAGYCHCENCRAWSAGPVNAFTLWKPEAVAVTAGEEHIGEYHQTEQSYRQWCQVCG